MLRNAKKKWRKHSKAYVKANSNDEEFDKDKDILSTSKLSTLARI